MYRDPNREPNRKYLGHSLEPTRYNYREQARAWNPGPIRGLLLDP